MESSQESSTALSMSGFRNTPAKVGEALNIGGAGIAWEPRYQGCRSKPLANSEKSPGARTAWRLAHLLPSRKTGSVPEGESSTDGSRVPPSRPSAHGTLPRSSHDRQNEIYSYT